jgi:hypothetical protein
MSIQDKLDIYKKRLEEKYITDIMTPKQKADRKVVIDMGIDAMSYGIQDFSQKIEKEVSKNKLILNGIITGIVIIATAVAGIIVQKLLGV